jgi:hypothetical protein
MKQLFVLMFLLVLCSNLLGNSNKVVVSNGIINQNNVESINQYFDGVSKDIKLEIYVLNRQGSVLVYVFDPTNKLVDTYKINNDVVQRIQQNYPSKEGNWKIVISPQNGSGRYIIKFHDFSKYLGMTNDDDKILGNTYVWQLK